MSLTSTPRASSALNTPARARSIMRLSMSVPVILTRAFGMALWHTAASVVASAP